MKIDKKSFITTKIGSLMLFVLIVCFALIGFSQNAQAEGWEVKIGAGYTGELVGDNTDNTSIYSGVNFEIGVGQRFNEWLKLINIEGSFRTIIDRTDNVCLIQDNPNSLKPNWRDRQYCEPEYMGASLFFAPQFYLFSNASTDVFAKVGSGIIFITYNERVADFGLRFGLGTTFWITKRIGLGLDADYDLAVLSTVDAIDKYGSGKQCGYINMFLHVMFKI